MRADEIDYQISGHDVQLLEVTLDPHETVIAEAGAMVYMDSAIAFETHLGDGSAPNQGFMNKLFSAGSRLLTGESIFMTHFTNLGSGAQKVAFAGPYPGSIVPIDLTHVGGQIIAQKEAFLCAAKGTKLSLHLNKKLGAGLVGGEGFILQSLTGDGMAFLHAGGTIVEKTLHNEQLRIDTGCIVAYEPQLQLDITQSGGMRSMLFGGEGLFLATLQGTSRVWLQSMPIRKFIRAINPAGENRSKGGRSILGNFLED